jgi:beta-xylosidase
MYTNVSSYSGNQGIWAPDIIFYNELYYIYYSFCAQPAAHAPCTIGLYTTPTLDSTSAKFKLTDAGKS